MNKPKIIYRINYSKFNNNYIYLKGGTDSTNTIDIIQRCNLIAEEVGKNIAPKEALQVYGIFPQELTHIPAIRGEQDMRISNIPENVKQSIYRVRDANQIIWTRDLFSQTTTYKFPLLEEVLWLKDKWGNLNSELWERDGHFDADLTKVENKYLDIIHKAGNDVNWDTNFGMIVGTHGHGIIPVENIIVLGYSNVSRIVDPRLPDKNTKLIQLREMGYSGEKAEALAALQHTNGNIGDAILKLQQEKHW